MYVEIIALLVINVLVIVIYFQILKQRYLEDIASAIISVSDVEYSFIVRRIRENATTVTLYGVDDIEIRINKEEFTQHQVAVGKLWVYDGIHHFCIDPNLHNDIKQEFH